MFAVHPKTDCPHLEELDFDRISSRLHADILHEPCKTCSDSSENWLCLTCESVFCSRYVNGHMVSHYEGKGHGVALSFSDASVWCYDCDSYVISPGVTNLTRKLGKLKFPVDGSPACGEERLPTEGATTKLPWSGPAAQIPEPIELSYDALVYGIRNKSFTKIVFLTGAGISVAAGIPDFRTPGTGLYAKVAELGLPFPEAIFSLDYLRANPEPFFKISKGFLSFKASPVKAHRFIKKVADEGQMLMTYTQNIDGLELEAGLSPHLLVQAHGHMRSAHCCECGVSAPITEFFEHVELEKVMYCTACADSSSAATPGIVKPDVIFFGEALPRAFFQKMEEISQADLVFVMGTSLKVFPFAALLDRISPGVPIVLVNREDPGNIDRDLHPVVFLKGEIEESIAKLASDVGWALEAEGGPANATESTAVDGLSAADVSGEKA